jgi:hypothetical protein
MEAQPEMATTRTSRAPRRRDSWVVERVPAAAAPVHQLVEVRTLHKRLPARTRPEFSGWTVGAALALTALLAVELAIGLRGSIGPSLDEAIYMTAGRRVLEGQGVSDGYLSWFAGSLLWPALAGVADGLGGLAGARVVAALLVALGMVGAWRAAVALYGRRAGFFTALAAALSGPVLALGHLAVIDAPAVAGMGIAFWAVTELTVRDDRRWLVLAGLAFAVGTVAKYPAVVCGLPLLALMCLLRGRRAITDLTVFALIAGAILLTYFMAYRGQIGYFVGWRASNNPSFGITPAMIAALQLWYSGPLLLLGAGGWLVSRRKALATVLLLAGLMFPAYHLAVGSNVGGSKHAVFGLLFLLPLAGRFLSGVSRVQAGGLLVVALLAGLGAHGVQQVRWLDRNFLDLRPAAAYIAGQARPGDDFLIDNGWPFTWRLYHDRRIRTPWQVFDTYRIEHHQQTKPLCRFDWFVAAAGGAPWPERIERRIRNCGTFRRVFHQRGDVSIFGSELRFMTLRGDVRVYRNVGRR